MYYLGYLQLWEASRGVVVFESLLSPNMGLQRCRASFSTADATFEVAKQRADSNSVMKRHSGWWEGLVFQVQMMRKNPCIADNGVMAIPPMTVALERSGFRIGHRQEYCKT